MTRSNGVGDYFQTRELERMIDGAPVRIMTKPGFAGWDAVNPTVDLLLDAIGADTADRLALFGCSHGALAVALARRMPQGRQVLVDTSAVALAMAERTLDANDVTSAEVVRQASLLPGGANMYDGVVIDLPQGRSLARRWLVEAHALLRPGGCLWLAGPNELGVQSVADDMGALFGNLDLFGYRRKCRAVTAVRQEVPPAPPDWASQPGIAPGTWLAVPAVVTPDGRRVEFASLAGVFSAEQLDEGTSLLLENLPSLGGLQVADIGCGYGVLGVAAALRGARAVAMVDANILAVAAARETCARLQIDATVLAGDALVPLAGRQFDVILSNPPFHTGKRVSYDVADVFMQQSFGLLRPGGRLVIVANRFIPYDRTLSALFGNVEVVAHTSRFQVLASMR